MQCDTTFLFLFGLVVEQLTHARAVYSVTHHQNKHGGQLALYSDVKQFRFICSSLTITEGRDHGLNKSPAGFIGKNGKRRIRGSTQAVCMLDDLVEKNRAADP